MEPTRFYIILREDDLRLRRHGSLAEASAEALRLADRHPGPAFVILKGKYEVKRKHDPPLLPAEVQNVHRFNEEGGY